MKVAYVTKYYNYFGHGERKEVKVFDNVLECQTAIREDRARQFNYGDAWFEVDSPYVIHDGFARPKNINRPHARGKYEWELLKHNRERGINGIEFSDEEYRYLLSLWDFEVNADDEEIME